MGLSMGYKIFRCRLFYVENHLVLEDGLLSGLLYVFSLFGQETCCIGGLIWRAEDGCVDNIGC